MDPRSEPSTIPSATITDSDPMMAPIDTQPDRDEGLYAAPAFDGGSSTDESTATTASDAASTAGEQAQRVASTTVEQARSVVDEAKTQVSDLVGQARSELRTQASDRSSQAAGGLRTLSDQIQALAQGRPGEAGPLTGYLDEARTKVSGFASRLDEGGVEGLLSDVSSFARRRPGIFLVAAAGTGFVVGRMVRSGRAATQSSPNGAPSTSAFSDGQYGNGDLGNGGRSDSGLELAGDVLPPPSPMGAAPELTVP